MNNAEQSAKALASLITIGLVALINMYALHRFDVSVNYLDSLLGLIAARLSWVAISGTTGE